MLVHLFYTAALSVYLATTYIVVEKQSASYIYMIIICAINSVLFGLEALFMETMQEYVIVCQLIGIYLIWFVIEIGYVFTFSAHVTPLIVCIVSWVGLIIYYANWRDLQSQDKVDGELAPLVIRV